MFWKIICIVLRIFVHDKKNLSDNFHSYKVTKTVKFYIKLLQGRTANRFPQIAVKCLYMMKGIK